LVAAVELIPGLPEQGETELLVSVAKSLANSQASGDLGMQADRALKAVLKS